MAKRVTIPADRPLISGVNIATINGKDLLRKTNINLLSNIDDFILIAQNKDLSSYYNDTHDKRLIDTTKLVIYYYIDEKSLYIPIQYGIDKTIKYFRVKSFSANPQFNGNTLYLYSGGYAYQYNSGSDTFSGNNINNKGNFTKLFTIKTVQYSLGTAVAADTIGTVEINTLTSNKIVINSIRPTTAVEGLMISQPYYNGTCWCINIYNKSASAFSGELEIIYQDYN